MNLDAQLDVRMHGEVVSAVGTLAADATEHVIDVTGMIVAPGFIDVHVHLREPGQEWKETIATGTAAAAAGGFTTIFCMPNTEPALDSVVQLEELKRRTDRDAVVSVRPIAAISEGRRGDTPVDYRALAAVGAVGFSDDGESTADSSVMRQALAASRELALPVMVHCEDPTLTGGAMHEGYTSHALKIQGLPALAEESIINRDIGLAALSGGWLHACHVSTGRGADLIARAKSNGVRVTAEVMPHHMTMTDKWVGGRRDIEHEQGSDGEHFGAADQDTKVNPPLRTTGDMLRLREALRAGLIDVIATDHAPHARHEKKGRSFMTAAFGLSGSEFALPLLLSLVRAGELTLREVVRGLCTTPARLWGLNVGTLRPGSPADVVVFDPAETWTPHLKGTISRGINTPLLDTELHGRTKLAFVGGDERYRDW